MLAVFRCLIAPVTTPISDVMLYWHTLDCTFTFLQQVKGFNHWRSVKTRFQLVFSCSLRQLKAIRAASFDHIIKIKSALPNNHLYITHANKAGLRIWKCMWLNTTGPKPLMQDCYPKAYIVALGIACWYHWSGRYYCRHWQKWQAGILLEYCKRPQPVVVLFIMTNNSSKVLHQSKLEQNIKAATINNLL